MSDIKIIMNRDIYLDSPVTPVTLSNALYAGDAGAQRIRFRCYQKHSSVAPLDLSSTTITAYFIRPDDGTVVITGVGGTEWSYVDLPQACYVYKGIFKLLIRAVSTDVTTSILYLTGRVDQPTTDTIIDPGTTIPSLAELLAQIDACEDATTAANTAAANATAATSYIADTYTAGTAYAVGDLVIYSGSLYKCNTAVASATDWTTDSSSFTATTVDAELLEDDEDLSQLSTDLENFNSYNILPIRHDSATSADVTFTSNGDGTYTVDGTSSGNAIYNIKAGGAESGYLDGLTAGDSFTVFFDGSHGVILQFYPYVNESLGSAFAEIATDCSDTGYIVTIPSDASAILVRLRVTSGTSVSNVTVHPVIYSVDSNAMLKEKVEDFASVVDGFNSSTITSNKLLRYESEQLVTKSGGFVSDFIPVVEGGTVKITYDLNSSNYGNFFYGEDKTTLVAKYYSNGANRTLTVPAGAAYLRVSGMVAYIDYMHVYVYGYAGYQMIASKAAFNALQKAEPHERYTIKSETDDEGTLTQHVAFPHMCYFNDKMYIIAREGYSHTTPTDSTQWGGIRCMCRTMDGDYTVIKTLTNSDFSGLSGELRDSKIQPTRDGAYLIFTGWTTYYDGTTAVHDNLIAILDKNYDVVSYKVFVQPSHLFWGNPLHTPEGRIIVTAYMDDTVVLCKTGIISDFTDISGVTYEEITIYTSTTSPTEGTIGYFNDKLVMLVRRQTTSALYFETSDLEGGSGWSTRVMIGIVLHAPVLLPYASGTWLPFAGAYLESSDSDRLRYPVIGYYNPTTNTVFYGKVDEEIDGYSGYCGLVRITGEEFGIVYYQEGESTSDPDSTGLYYKQVNTRALIPQSNFLM